MGPCLDELALLGPMASGHQRHRPSAELAASSVLLVRHLVPEATEGTLTFHAKIVNADSGTEEEGGLCFAFHEGLMCAVV